MIRPSVVIIEFCALADSGQMQRYLQEDNKRLLDPAATLQMFQVYAADAVLVAHTFPFGDQREENVPQLLPCPN